MKKNMSGIDKMVRVLFAVIAAVLYFTGTLPGTFGLILVIVGGILLLTTVINFCPIYAALGINTLSMKKKVNS